MQQPPKNQLNFPQQKPIPEVDALAIVASIAGFLDEIAGSLNLLALYYKKKSMKEGILSQQDIDSLEVSDNEQ